MELLQLTYFCNAAENENFSKTAEKFGVPASNISQSIHRLESELGTTLFDRYANRIVINERGKRFFQDIKHALDLIEHAKHTLQDAGHEMRGDIKLCVCVNRRIVTRAIEDFKRQYRDVSFIVSHGLPDQAGGYDMIVSDRVVEGENWEREPLITEKIMLATGKNDPLANKKEITPGDLKGRPFVTMPSGSSLYRYTQLFCQSMGFVPDIAIQSDDPYYLRKYIASGVGIALVPEFSWRGQFQDHIVLRDIGNYIRNTYVFRKKDGYFPRRAEMFLRHLQAECATPEDAQKGLAQ